MFRKIAIICSVLVLAFSILSVSVLRAASVNYAFYKQGSASLVLNQSQLDKSKIIQVDYFFPYEGKILPDNSLWPAKALRDKLWLTLTTNSSRKAELNLLFSDKRLIAAKRLFESKKAELAFSTLSKGEKYLEEASNLNELNRKKGIDTTSFEIRLVTAALKHRQIIEDLITIAPEDAKPGLLKVLDYAKNIYKTNRDALLSKKIIPPESPYNAD